MPITPKGSILYFPSLSVNLRVDAVKYSFISEIWLRNEFSHEKLRQAKNTDGSKPIFIELFGGRLIQYMTTCGVNTTRPVTPDDTDIDNIMKRWDIKRYQITGSVSFDSSVETVYQQSIQHKILLDRLQAHIEEVTALDVSYTELASLQTETFGYITSTSFPIYGDPISPNTTLTGGVSIGGMSLPIVNSGGFAIGESVIINAAGGSAEAVSITGVSPGTLAVSALAHNHSTGESVQLYETNMLISEFSPEVARVIPTTTNYTVRKQWELTLENRILTYARNTVV